MTKTAVLRRIRFVSSPCFIIPVIVLSLVPCCRRDKEPSFSKIDNDVPLILSDPERPEAPGRKIVFREIWKFHRDGWWPQGILPDSSGRILIPTYRENKIYVVDQNGDELDVMEFREGQGPGEFSSIEPQLAADGDLHVYDRLQRKITVIGGKDRVIKKIIKNSDMCWVFSLTPRGEFYFWTVRFRPEIPDVQDLVLCRYDANGKLVKEYDRYAYAPVKIDNNGKRIYDLYRPYGIHKIDQAGNCYAAFSDRYEIKIYSPDGRLGRRMSLKTKPRKTNEKDLANILPYFSEFSKDKNKISLIPPVHMPEIADIHVLSDASLLVVTFDPSDDSRVLNADWFSPEGRFLNRQKIPKYYLWFKTFGPGKSHAVFDGEFFYSVEATTEAEDDFVVKKYSIKITE